MQPLRKHVHIVKTGERQPAPADSVEQIKKEAEALAARLKAISKKEELGAPICTADLPDRKAAREIDKQIKRLTELSAAKRALETEEKTIKADLKMILIEYKASAIEAPTGRYCAQPSEACITVREAGISYVPRAV